MAVVSIYYKKEIRKVIEELNGMAFKNSRPYTRQAKDFFEERYLKIFSFLPGIKSKQTGLEIGLSGGVMAFSLKNIFNLKTLYAIEHPITSREFNSKYLTRLRSNNILLKRADITKDKFPLKDNSVDFVIFSEVMEHLVPARIPYTIGEIKRVLKSGGWVLVTTPNISSLLKRINLLTGKNPIEFDLGLHENATFGHIREYTIDEVKSVLKNAGLKIKQSNYFSIDTKRNIYTYLEYIASKVLPSLANNIVILARK